MSHDNYRHITVSLFAFSSLDHVVDGLLHKVLTLGIQS